MATTVSADDIQGLYIAYFNRPADFLGLQFWTNAANAHGGDINTVANAFAASPEYTAAFTGKSTAQIIDQIYMNLFGRHAELDGIKFWGSALDNHILGIGNIAYQIMKGAQNDDAVAVANKIQAATAFYNALDTTAEVTAYSGDAANAVAKQWLGAVTADPATLNAAISDAGLTAVTAAVVQAGTPPVPGVTFTLTTGIDTGSAFIGGTGDDTFNAVGTSGTGAANAFNALDSIDGKGGNNTLNVVSSLDTSLSATAVTVKNIQTVNFTEQGALTLDTSNWTGLTNLNVSTSTGAGAITSAATTAIVQNNTLTTGAAHSTTSVDGGSTVNLTVVGSGTNGANVLTGDVVVGGNAAPAGAVNVTSTEKIGVATSSAGNINVLGGTDVTVVSTVNSSFAVAAAAAYGGTGAAAAVTAGNANAIVVNGASGVVNVTSNTNTTSAATGMTVNGAEIDVKGGSTITVTANAGTAAADTNTETIVLGKVNVTGDAHTSAVTVTQTAADDAVNGDSGGASAAVAGVTGVNGVTAVGAAAGVQAVAGVTAVNGGTTVIASDASSNVAVVTNGAVTVTDKNNTSTSTSSIKTVTLNNYGANSAIVGAGLTTLNLSGTGGTLAITNGAAAGATNTTLTLNVNGLNKTFNGADNTITDTNNEITTLNVVTGASSSSITGIKDTGLTKLNVSGSSTLTLATAPSTAGYTPGLATIAVTGAAGFNADVSGLGATLTSFTTTSSGKITATLDAANQTFVGASGQDVITIKVNPTKTITGGTGTADQLVLGNTVAAAGDAGAIFTAAKMANVTGFESLGINNATATNVSNYDMHNVFTGYSTVELISAMTGKQTISGAADGTKLLIDKAQTSVEFDLFNASTTGVANVTVNKTSSGAGITVGTLTLNDSNADGIATLNLTSNSSASAPAGGTGVTNTITTLADTSLSTLNITGSASVAIGTVSLGQPGQAVPVGIASLTINDNSTSFSNNTTSKVAGVITTLTDDTLGSLNFTGSNNFTITTLNDNNAVNLSINNTGKGAVTIGTLNGDQQATTVIHNGLSNLTFTGSGSTTVNSIVLAANTANLNYANSGTGSVAIGALNDGTQLATTGKLTLSGNIALGASGATVAADHAGAVTFANTGGFTLAAGTDNAHLSVELTGATAGNTDTITVGNANNYILDGSTAGTVTVTAGTGFNYVDLSAGANNATYAGNVTFGTHTSTATAYDKVLVSVIGTQATGVSNVITGASAGDVVVFKTASDVTFQALTAAQQSVVTADGTLAAAIAHAFADVGGTANVATAFTWQGDTYAIYDANGTGLTAGTDGVVKIVGVHTVADFGTVVGAVTLTA